MIIQHILMSPMLFDPASFFHIDVGTVILAAGGAFIYWYKSKSKVDNTENQADRTQILIETHVEECGRYKKETLDILGKIENAITRLATIGEGHEKRLDRLEDAFIKK